MAKILTPDYVSFDESGTEDGKGVIFVKDLPWRHKRITNFFQKLDDDYNLKNQNKPAGRLKKE